MSLAATAFNQIMIMFLIILVGIFCYRIHLIDKITNKKLSDMVLMLVNPIVILVSYQREFEATLLKGLLISLLLAVITHIFGIVIGYVIIRGNKHKSDLAIERFAVVYSNCGFIGIPMAGGLFGSEGVFYITAYMTIFNLLVWTHGIIIMTDKADLKSIGKALLSPSVIATVVGFLLFVTRIMLPDILTNALTYIGNMNTPLAMLVAGITIAQTDLKKLLGKLRIYYISFLKLLFVPIVMLILFRIFDLPEVVLLTSVLAAACPTAATVNLFSLRYEKNYLYASEIFAVSTILSLITIPLVMYVANLVL
ncbi:MAG: putative rane protein [Herbinix sp.]|jgi:predicted permease|nr:putative rane protein [Herbinix sp.]